MKDKRNCHGTVGKSSLEQHFENPPSLLLSCEIYGALHLVQSGLMAGRLAGWQMKYSLISKFSKLDIG